MLLAPEGSQTHLKSYIGTKEPYYNSQRRITYGEPCPSADPSRAWGYASQLLLLLIVPLGDSYFMPITY